jgi:hypothetical protein
MEVLGGVLDDCKPTEALINHRFGKGEKTFFAYRKQFVGKASVGLKLSAFSAVPRASALFLTPVIHWSGSLLQEAVRWERKLLRQVFKLRRKPDEGSMMYNERTAKRLQDWFHHCHYKQIHVAILERMFSFAWHERTTDDLAACIRRDRDTLFWQAISDVPAAKRRKEGDTAIHVRGGPQ